MTAKNHVLKYEGDVRMWTIDPSTGNRSPILADLADYFGNVPVEASANVFTYEAGDTVDVRSKRVDRYNQVLYSEAEPGTSSLSLTLVAVPPALLARVFYGEAADVTVSGGSVIDEEVTFTALAPAQALAHDYLSASPAPVVTNSAGGTTYVAGTDYAIDLRLGRIIRLADGSIGAADTVKVSYTHNTYQLTRIRGGVKPQESFYILGDYKNRPDLARMRLEVFQANLSTDGDVDLFSSEPITVTLTGPLITPQSETEPYIAEWVEAGQSIAPPPAPVAARLAFVTPISGGEEAADFGPVQVRVEAADGTLVTGDNTTSVALVKAVGPGDITVTTPVTAVAGIATFPTISADTAGDIVLLATAAGLTSAASPTITITPA